MLTLLIPFQVHSTPESDPPHALLRGCLGKWWEVAGVNSRQQCGASASHGRGWVGYHSAVFRHRVVKFHNVSTAHIVHMEPGLQMPTSL
jgi:hypothetical protein